MEWRDIPGYEGIYKVSEYGDVCSLPRVIMRSNGRKKTIIGTILKPCEYDKYGHMMVTLKVNGLQKHETIHSLVMLSFVGPRQNGECVIRHLDGNPKNNYIGNLVYGTRSENAIDMSKHGRARSRKLSVNDVLNIRYMLNNGIPHRRIAKEYNIHPSSVMDIKTRRSYAWIEPFQEDEA